MLDSGYGDLDRAEAVASGIAGYRKAKERSQKDRGPQTSVLYVSMLIT